MSQRHATLNIAKYKFFIFPTCSAPTSDFIFSLNDKWHFVNPSIQTLGRHSWNIINRLINLTSESTSLHLYCHSSGPRQHHLLSGLLSSAMNWVSFFLFRFGIYGYIWWNLKYICCLPLFKPVLIKNWMIKMYDEEITNFYKKGRHWKSRQTGESQLASVGREEGRPEISWFSSFHCKSPPPNPPPERLKSNRSQHWHSGKWLATGFPGKWIHQTNKQKYWFIVFADYHEANTLWSISNY